MAFDHDNNKDTQVDLIGSLYGASLEPDSYDELIARWDSLLSGLIDEAEVQPDPDANLPPTLEQLKPHFDHAYEALIRLGRNSDGLYTSAFIDADPRACFWISPDGLVNQVNKAARTQFEIAQNDSLTAFIPSEKEQATLKGILYGLQQNPGSAPPGNKVLASLTLVNRQGEGTPMALLAVESPGPKSETNTCARLIAPDIQWSEATGTWVQESFDLSEAESDVLRALVSGSSVSELAEAKGRSIETIRSQLKSLLRKTNLNSQIEVIKLFAGFDQANERLPKPSAIGVGQAGEQLLLADGRLLQYDCYGPEPGRPVLFLHGMLDGTEPTTQCKQVLADNNWRMICPWRPHFAGSSPDNYEDPIPEGFARDIALLLNDLGIGSLPVIGHLAGAPYAFAFAAALPEKVDQLLIVGGCVPITSDRQISLMSTRQRIIALSARYTPRLLPLILRAAISQIDYKVENLVKAMYASSAADQIVVKREEVAQLVYAGYQSSVVQGHKGFQNDGTVVLGDWSEYATTNQRPVTLVHGTRDPVVHISTVREFADKHQLSLHEYEDSGQLIWYDKPGDIFSKLEN